MCGRFTLTIEVSDIENELHLEVMAAGWKPRFNIAPTQPVLAITNMEPQRVNILRWGLIPYWAKDPLIGNKLINARAETLAEKPSFRKAYELRRCWILADGFYEWDRSSALAKKSGKAVPLYIHLYDRQLFGFAGLWERWTSPEGKTISSCTIITCQPNELIQPIHNRMPVILTPEQMHQWIRSDLPLEEADRYLRPFPSEKMVMYPVCHLVNNPAIDQPDLLLPLAG